MKRRRLKEVDGRSDERREMEEVDSDTPDLTEVWRVLKQLLLTV